MSPETGRKVASKLVRFGAELAAGLLDGADANPLYIAEQLIQLAIQLVGPEVLKSYLTPLAAQAINTEVDVEMDLKLAGKE